MTQVANPDFLLGLFFDPEDGHMFLRKVCWLLNGLHSVLSQKKEGFVTTGVRTWNPSVLFFDITSPSDPSRTAHDAAWVPRCHGKLRFWARSHATLSLFLGYLIIVSTVCCNDKLERCGMKRPWPIYPQPSGRTEEMHDKHGISRHSIEIWAREVGGWSLNTPTSVLRWKEVTVGEDKTGRPLCANTGTPFNMLIFSKIKCFLIEKKKAYLFARPVQCH
jgi:hypothetical protein